MPTARYKLSTSVVEGKIYAIGGFPAGPAVGVVEEYDPATDTWTRKTDMPEAQAGHSASVVNGKIYVIWGAIVQIYDPITDAWTRGTDRPSQPIWGPASVVDGKIYTIGGISYGADPPILSTVEEYDPATDTWTTKADMPTPRDGSSTTVVNGKIYAIGGSNNYGGATGDQLVALSQVEVYDPPTDSWTDGPPLPFARMNLSVCAVDEMIYAMGGFQPNPGGSVFAFGAVNALDLTPVVDFNQDGAVDIDDLLRLIESWGLNDPLVDIGPMPWGDGVVDAKDVLVLAERMVAYANDPDDIQ